MIWLRGIQSLPLCGKEFINGYVHTLKVTCKICWFLYAIENLNLFSWKSVKDFSLIWLKTLNFVIDGLGFVILEHDINLHYTHNQANLSLLQHTEFKHLSTINFYSCTVLYQWILA